MIRTLTTLLALLLAGSAAAQDITTGLVGHWKLQDAAASTTVVATVGSNGVLTGAGNTSASSVAGPGGSLPLALDMDGTDDWIDFGDVHDFGTGDFSYGGWVSAGSLLTQTAATGARAFNKRGTGSFGSTPGWFLNLYRDSTTLKVSNNGGIDDNSSSVQWSQGTTVGTIGTWVHLFVTADRDGNMVVYTNGTAAETVSISGVTGSVSNARKLTIGGSDATATQYFDGAFADFRVYSRVLTPADVAQLVANPFFPNRFAHSYRQRR